MAEAITADKVLAVAFDMEEMGRTFYLSLAEGCGNQQMAVLCNRLSREELKHADTFNQMRKEAGGKAIPLSDRQAQQFHELVKEAVMPKPPDVSKLVLKGGVQEALDMAIRMEQDSISFYENILRPVRPDQLSVVQEIIHQEKRHLSDLLAQRKSLKA